MFCCNLSGFFAFSLKIFKLSTCNFTGILFFSKSINQVSSRIPYSQSCLPSFNVTQLLNFIEKNYTSGFVGNCCNHCKLEGPNLKLLLEKDTKSCISSQC